MFRDAWASRSPGDTREKKQRTGWLTLVKGHTRATLVDMRSSSRSANRRSSKSKA